MEVMSSPQSRVFRTHNTQVDVKVGVTKTLEFTMDFGLSETVHDTARFKAWKPGATASFITKQGSDVSINHPAGTVSVNLVADDISTNDIGNWEGEIEFYDKVTPENPISKLSDHSFTLGFNIIASL